MNNTYGGEPSQTWCEGPDCIDVKLVEMTKYYDKEETKPFTSYGNCPQCGSHWMYWDHQRGLHHTHNGICPECHEERLLNDLELPVPICGDCGIKAMVIGMGGVVIEKEAGEPL